MVAVNAESSVRTCVLLLLSLLLMEEGEDEDELSVFASCCSSSDRVVVSVCSIEGTFDDLLFLLRDRKMDLLSCFPADFLRRLRIVLRIFMAAVLCYCSRKVVSEVSVFFVGDQEVFLKKIKEKMRLAD